MNFIQYSQHSSYRWGNWGSVTYSGSHSEEVPELWCIPRQSVLSFLLSKRHMKDWGLGSPRLVMHLGRHQLTVTPSLSSPHPLPRSGVPSGLNWKTICSSNHCWVNQRQDLIQAGQIQLFLRICSIERDAVSTVTLKYVRQGASGTIFSADTASLQERGGWGYAERGRDAVSPRAPSGFHFLVLALPDAKSGL